VPNLQFVVPLTSLAQMLRHSLPIEEGGAGDHYRDQSNNESVVDPHRRLMGKQ
jgi:hypothetical protein